VENEGAILDVTDTVGKRITELRKALDLTQRDFAAGLHISTSHICALEKGQRRLNDRLVSLMALNFGVNEDWLKTGAGEMFTTADSARLAAVVRNFKKLDGLLQDYALKQLDLLLEYQSKAGRDASGRDPAEN
jgi:transcriptional regulator with XRE-family HTH domain